MGREPFAQLIEDEFLPKWEAALKAWLQQSPNWDEVAAWYRGWKGLLSPQMRAHERVRLHLNYALDLMDTAHYYRQYRRLMTHWKALYGADILDFDYDAFVREPRPAVERLLAFCGLDWEDDCMSFHRVQNAVKTASVWQVREPLYLRSSGRWRNYARHLGPLRAHLEHLGDR